MLLKRSRNPFSTKIYNPPSQIYQTDVVRPHHMPPWLVIITFSSCQAIYQYSLLINIPSSPRNLVSMPCSNIHNSFTYKNYRASIFITSPNNLDVKPHSIKQSNNQSSPRIKFQKSNPIQIHFDNKKPNIETIMTRIFSKIYIKASENIEKSIFQE